MHHLLTLALQSDPESSFDRRLDQQQVVIGVISQLHPRACHVRPGTHIHFKTHYPGHASVGWSTWCIITTAQTQASGLGVTFSACPVSFPLGCALFAAALTCIKGFFISHDITILQYVYSSF